jgi:hypothetical protein
MQGYINGYCEKHFLLGYNAVETDRSSPTIRRNILPPFSGSNNESRKKSARNRRLSEDGCSTFFRNIFLFVPKHMTLLPLREEFLGVFSVLL